MPPIQLRGNIRQGLGISRSCVIFQGGILPAAYGFIVEYRVERSEQHIQAVMSASHQRWQIRYLNFRILVENLCMRGDAVRKAEKNNAEGNRNSETARTVGHGRTSAADSIIGGQGCIFPSFAKLYNTMRTLCKRW